jgi:predicted tellurium resistance membrane protein TerC
MLADLFTPEMFLALFTLTTLEIVLGIDNVIFISIVAGRLPEDEREKARKIGLLGALVMRILLLVAIVWIVGLTTPVATIMDLEISWRDIILLAGGLFLLAKGTHEIHKTVEGDAHSSQGSPLSGLTAAIAQIMVLDIIFSLDSVITAVGMVDELAIMIAAVVIAIGFMLWASKPLSAFIDKHPTVKMLALAFLLLIGVALMADGLHFHIPRGYLYFAVAFSILVESLNLVAAKHRLRKQQKMQQGE